MSNKTLLDFVPGIRHMKRLRNFEVDLTRYIIIFNPRFPEGTHEFSILKGGDYIYSLTLIVRIYTKIGFKTLSICLFGI